MERSRRGKEAGECVCVCNVMKERTEQEEEVGAGRRGKEERA